MNFQEYIDGVYDRMQNLETLPKQGLEGDLCKHQNQPLVYFDKSWINLNDAANMINSLEAKVRGEK